MAHRWLAAGYAAHLHLTTNGAPDVVDSVLLTYLFGIVQRRWAVAVRDHEYVLRWEDL